MIEISLGNLTWQWKIHHLRFRIDVLFDISPQDLELSRWQLGLPRCM